MQVSGPAMLLARVKSGGRASTFRRGSSLLKRLDQGRAEVLVGQIGLGRAFSVVEWSWSSCVEQSGRDRYDFSIPLSGVPMPPV